MLLNSQFDEFLIIPYLLVYLLWAIFHNLSSCLFVFYLFFFKHFIQRTMPFKGTGVTKRFPNMIPQCKELTIVVVVKEMMVSMVCTSIDEWFYDFGYAVITIMNRNSPDVNKQEESQICNLCRKLFHLYFESLLITLPLKVSMTKEWCLNKH